MNEESANVSMIAKWTNSFGLKKKVRVSALEFVVDLRGLGLEGILVLALKQSSTLKPEDAAGSKGKHQQKQFPVHKLNVFNSLGRTNTKCLHSGTKNMEVRKIIDCVLLCVIESSYHPSLCSS